MTQPGQTGTMPGPGQVSYDYSGSYDEWFERVVSDLIYRYSEGLGGASITGGTVGAPAQEDYGNGTVSYATEQYWENFVRQYGGQSQYIISTYGPAPERHASYVTDPNSPAATNAAQREENQLDRDFEATQSALDREHDATENAADRAVQRESIAAGLEEARMREAGATERVQMQIASDQAMAAMDDATRRYIAEGDWGVQKWMTEENNRSSMERLMEELGFRREELAQRAIEEKNRHQENLVSLALEVAQYDAELAASPRNWVAYAAWLQNRNVVVNGLSLAMAAQEVPEEMIDPSEVAGSGDNMAALQQGLVSGQSGGSASPMSGSGLTADMYGPGSALPQHQPSMSPDQIGSTDPGDLANQLLGSNPLAPTQQDYSTQNMQAVSDSMQTAGQDIAGFGAYGGPTTNAMGVNVAEVTGSDVDYRQFAKLLPSQQEAKIGEVESVRGPWGGGDFIAEMQRSKPKGQAAGVSAYG